MQEVFFLFFKHLAGNCNYVATLKLYTLITNIFKVVLVVLLKRTEKI